VGIAECSPEYETADDLLRDADAAMYQAKNMGRGRFIVFDETMHQRLMDDLNIEQALHHAVKDQSLFPRYLSMHNVKTGDCLGYKTKTYWHHPELGEVEQSYFIELAESNGLITTIDQQILTEVCWQMRKGGQLEDVGIISVNLSATHLTQRSSLQLLLDIVKASGIDRHKLCFEFTESSLLKLADVSLNAFKRIKQTGVSIAIQGFGAGVSSLGLLTQNRIDYVKTDRNFTRSLLKNTKHKALLETLIKLSFSFDFKVILEGIDNKELQELALDYQVFIGLGDHFDSQEVVKAAQKPVLRLHKFA
jgi:EAL domain-containing protein (putative c-di-GMP-specific phosphodiesterase class I)